MGCGCPRVYRTEDLDDVHLAIWMEDVQHRSGTWSDDDYRRAGTLLGRMWGRIRDPDLPDDIELVTRNLQSYFVGRIVHGVLPDLMSDATWDHPVLADAADPRLRADLARLTEAAPSILDRLDALPQGATHGDACPQNLLRSADGDERSSRSTGSSSACARSASTPDRSSPDTRSPATWIPIGTRPRSTPFSTATSRA